MKNVLLILIAIVVGVGLLAASQIQHSVYLPVVYYDPPPSSSTPKLPTPAPTVTPLPVWDENGNTCVHIAGAIKDRTGGVIVGGLVPSVCSHMVIHDWQQDGQLVVLKAVRIKTNTWGCLEGDFGPLVTWPPIDAECPSPDNPISEWGEILWGDYDVLKLVDSAQTVCGYCEECGPPYTRNCVDVK